MHEKIQNSGRANRFKQLIAMGVSEATILKGIEIIESFDYDKSEWSFFTDIEEHPYPLVLWHAKSGLNIDICILDNEKS